MSRRPQNSAPPGRPGPVRRDRNPTAQGNGTLPAQDEGSPPAPDNGSQPAGDRSFHWPDMVETVMLAAFRRGLGSTGDISAPIDPVDQRPGETTLTRVLRLPRGKHSSGPLKFSAEKPAPDLGEPGRAVRDPVRAGGADAADAQHGVRGRSALPVLGPPGDRALAARRCAPGQLRHLLLRRPGALPGAGRSRRHHRRAGGRARGQPAGDADHHRAAVLPDPAHVQRTGRAVRHGDLLGHRVRAVPGQSGHLRRARAVPAGHRGLDRGAHRGIPLAGLPAGRAAGHGRGGHQVRLGAVRADHRAAQRAGGVALPRAQGADPAGRPHRGDHRPAHRGAALRGPVVSDRHPVHHHGPLPGQHADAGPAAGQRQVGRAAVRPRGVRGHRLRGPAAHRAG